MNRSIEGPTINREANVAIPMKLLSIIKASTIITKWKPKLAIPTFTLKVNDSPSVNKVTGSDPKPLWRYKAIAKPQNKNPIMVRIIFFILVILPLHF